MDIRVIQKTKHSWDFCIGKIIISHIHYFDKCEVQDPDEPPFVPFYQVSFNLNGHTDHSVGTAVETFEEAVDAALTELGVVNKTIKPQIISKGK